MARLTGLGMSEVLGLLSDIRASYGSPIRYDRPLTSFETVENPYTTTSKEVFVKYGISNIQKLNADRIEYKKKTKEWPPHFEEYGQIDSKYANYPTGWELVVNQEIFSEKYFTRYHKNYIKLHKERERTDWASYRRLLSSYIGVEEDGHLRKGMNDSSRFCLREVMLGYLNSVELVKDGNCKACSVCVPDLNFDKFTAEERNAQIIRAESTTIITTKEVDEKFITNIPTIKDVNNWIDQFEKDEVSIWGYLDGFTVSCQNKLEHLV